MISSKITFNCHGGSSRSTVFDKASIQTLESPTTTILDSPISLAISIAHRIPLANTKLLPFQFPRLHHNSVEPFPCLEPMAFEEAFTNSPLSWYLLVNGHSSKKRELLLLDMAIKQLVIWVHHEVYS